MTINVNAAATGPNVDWNVDPTTQEQTDQRQTEQPPLPPRPNLGKPLPPLPAMTAQQSKIQEARNVGLTPKPAAIQNANAEALQLAIAESQKPLSAMTAQQSKIQEALSEGRDVSPEDIQKADNEALQAAIAESQKPSSPITSQRQNSPPSQAHTRRPLGRRPQQTSASQTGLGTPPPSPRPQQASASQTGLGTPPPSPRPQQTSTSQQIQGTPLPSSPSAAAKATTDPKKFMLARDQILGMKKKMTENEAYKNEKAQKGEIGDYKTIWRDFFQVGKDNRVLPGDVMAKATDRAGIEEMKKKIDLTEAEINTKKKALLTGYHPDKHFGQDVKPMTDVINEAFNESERELTLAKGFLMRQGAALGMPPKDLKALGLIEESDLIP